MSRETLTGSRIRERRQIARLRQADLAREIGISASYLNLIEHNRRRIGGKLLLKIAQALGVEASVLTEGAEAALLASLREAEADLSQPGVELDRIEEFAGRFPGWAGLIAKAQKRMNDLEHTVESLSDRLAHDPALAASVHEVLSTAASIRSTASILAETDQLEREWLDRFHGNINQDSERLAESSRALAGYLERGQHDRDGPRLPQEEVDAFLSDHQMYFPDLETGVRGPDDVLDGVSLSSGAIGILRRVLEGYAADARLLSVDHLRAMLVPDTLPDPGALAMQLGLPAPLILRRLACLPELAAGFALFDRAGAILLHKAAPGFSLPRFGAACPFWPVFQATGQPGALVHQRVEQVGRNAVILDCYAASEHMPGAAYNRAPLVRSQMLVLPARTPGDAEIQLGTACRVCSIKTCDARREPSVLTELP